VLQGGPGHPASEHGIEDLVVLGFRDDQPRLLLGEDASGGAKDSDGCGLAHLALTLRCADLHPVER
jgi:hypothetical protein